MKLRLKRCYEIRVSKDDWMTVSRTLHLYHSLIASVIFVEVEDEVVKASFEYYVWNYEQLNNVIVSLRHIHGIKMSVTDIDRERA